MSEKEICFTRRGFLKVGSAFVLSSFFTDPAFAKVTKYISREKSVSFLNIHTGEKLDTVFWSNGKYLPDALAKIDYILRDYRTDEVKRIDTGLLDLLHALRLMVEKDSPFHVISGYRSPKTNAMLRRKSSGVAKRSLHTKGMAIDISVPGYSLYNLRQAAIALKQGGVGYYPGQFVHVDVGRVRYW
jgi:uncharacterized protein YcbK (DUF882 family)